MIIGLSMKFFQSLIGAYSVKEKAPILYLAEPWRLVRYLIE